MSTLIASSSGYVKPKRRRIGDALPHEKLKRLSSAELLQFKLSQVKV